MKLSGWYYLAGTIWLVAYYPKKNLLVVTWFTEMIGQSHYTASQAYLIFGSVLVVAPQNNKV